MPVNHQGGKMGKCVKQPIQIRYLVEAGGRFKNYLKKNNNYLRPGQLVIEENKENSTIDCLLYYKITLLIIFFVFFVIMNVNLLALGKLLK